MKGRQVIKNNEGEARFQLPPDYDQLTTRWPEVALLSSISAEYCALAFLSTWISRFGVPAVLTSDRGAQFTSSVWAGICSSLGISASTTIPQFLSNKFAKLFLFSGTF